MNPIPLADEDRLVALVRDPKTTEQRWAAEAACAEHHVGKDAYFPEDGNPSPTEALACCLGCPVAHECLATALVHETVAGSRHGWWGGLGPVEREALWARIEPAASLPVDVHLTTPAAVARYLRERQRTIASIAELLGCAERTVYRYLSATDV